MPHPPYNWSTLSCYSCDNCNTKWWIIQCWLTLIKLVSTMCFYSKATPTNDFDYSCHIKVYNLFNQSYGAHITPLVNNSLGDGHTYICTNRLPRQKQITKPGVYLISNSQLVLLAFKVGQFWLKNGEPLTAIFSLCPINRKQGFHWYLPSKYTQCKVCFMVN